MLNFISKTIFQKRGLLNVQYPLHIITTSKTRSISTNNTTIIQTSFTISYLINSCGLSPQKAISTSQKVQFNTSSNPDSVLTLLRNNGFTNTHITKLIQGNPQLLILNPHKTLKPKFDFFHSIGFTNPDLTKVLCKEPSALSRSLHNHIIPLFRFLKNITHTDANVVKLVKCARWILSVNPHARLAPNIALLQAHGVPLANISSLLLNEPGAFVRNADRLNKIVKEMKGMGFDPVRCMFVTGIHAFVAMKKSVWEAKRQAYQRWGWSEEEFRRAFVRQPQCMMISEKKLMHIMDFVVNKMGYDPSLLAKHPTMLLYSLEKRIIPRCSVVRVLILNGLVKKDFSLSSLLNRPDKYFLKNYVIKFEEQIPELLDVYQGKVNGLELLSAQLDVKAAGAA